MITDVTKRDRLYFIVGRLEGLSGTVRYEIPDELREEIKECAAELRRMLGERELAK